jgi:hypothetical protein
LADEAELVLSAVAKIRAVDAAPEPGRPGRPEAFLYDVTDAATNAAAILRDGKYKRLFTTPQPGKRVMSSLDPRTMRGEAYPAYVLLAEERTAQEKVVEDLIQLLQAIERAIPHRDRTAVPPPGLEAQAAAIHAALVPLQDVVATMQNDVMGVDVRQLTTRLQTAIARAEEAMRQ